MENFIFLYDQLSDDFKMIVFRVLREMKHKKVFPKESKSSPDIRTGLRKILKEQGITEGQLIKKINDKMKNEFYDFYDCKETYRSMMKRNSIHSELLPIILEILGISKKRLLEVSPNKYNHIINQTECYMNPTWLFNTLTEENQKTITCLVRSLYELEMRLNG